MSLCRQSLKAVLGCLLIIPVSLILNAELAEGRRKCPNALKNGKTLCWWHWWCQFTQSFKAISNFAWVWLWLLNTFSLPDSLPLLFLYLPIWVSFVLSPEFFFCHWNASSEPFSFSLLCLNWNVHFCSICSAALLFPHWASFLSFLEVRILFSPLYAESCCSLFALK